MTIRADEVYRTLRELAGAWFKNQGFRRTAGRILDWYKPINDEYLIVSFWCFPKGSDRLAGSKFTVEIERSAEPKIFSAAPGEKRKRLAELLDVRQQERGLEIQNLVISRLERPGKDHFIFSLPQTIIDSYLWEFEPLTPDNALWYREWYLYKDADDVRLWAQFILEMLPGALSLFIPDLQDREDRKNEQGQ
jgi:hypothetical protein